MPINLDIIGKKFEAPPFSYDKDLLILYALGIGADSDELDFIYEKNLKVYPTFSVIPFIPLFYTFAKRAHLNMQMLLHGGQEIYLYKPLSPKGTLFSSLVCESIYDKKEKGAVVHLKTQSKDEHGDMVFENKSVFVDRASGNFGGSRGPKFEPINPPEDKEPVFTTEYVTSQNQGALYRLSGDKNPLHIDPEYAQKSGFSKPILHGLCSFGFTGRAILHNLCQSDPGRLRSFGAKFINVVFPGDTLITKGWSTEQEGQFIIRTTNQDGKIILGSAMVETM